MENNALNKEIEEMKNVIITGGPTNEYIDEVMKITNMSTGSLSTGLSKCFLSGDYRVFAIFNHSVNTEKIEQLMLQENISKDCFRLYGIETTEDMIEAFGQVRKDMLAENLQCDAIIHAAAVGDYKGEFSFFLEDMAEELFAAKDSAKSAADFLKIMENPKCKLNDDTKISSYQKNLTSKLTLTPKVIAKLREWFPNSLLLGCKLLEGVSKDELYDVAAHLAEKNRMNYILANDLADLRSGRMARHLCTKDGFTGTELAQAEDIFEFVNGELDK